MTIGIFFLIGCILIYIYLYKRHKKLKKQLIEVENESARELIQEVAIEVDVENIKHCSIALQTEFYDEEGYKLEQEKIFEHNFIVE